MEVKENNILTFYRGQEDVVVNEKDNYIESLFKDQYTHALLQIHQLVSKQKEGVPSILAFCGDRGEGKTSCMETVKTMLASINSLDDNKTKTAVNSFMQKCIVNQYYNQGKYICISQAFKNIYNFSHKKTSLLK